MKNEYTSSDGRHWWVDEAHPLTDERCAVCRELVSGHLMHTSVRSRHELKPVKQEQQQ